MNAIGWAAHCYEALLRQPGDRHAIGLIAAEDKEQLEGVQKGMKSRSFHGGPLAPPDFEGTIWDFTKYIAAKLGSDVRLASDASEAAE